MSYVPELGQLLYGQPHKEYAVPDIMDAALQFIGHELERVIGNLTQSWIAYADPFGNSGEAFRCDVFGVWAYSWSDEEQPYNFFHVPTGLRLSWYKYSGRGMSADRVIRPDLASEVLESCLAALQAVEEEGAKYMKGGIGQIPYFDETPHENTAKSEAKDVTPNLSSQPKGEE